MGHGLALNTTNAIVRQTDKYFEAISASLNMAIAGCKFAEEAMDFIKALLDERSSIQDRKDYIESMIAKANVASQQSFAAEEEFRKVRTGLFEVIFIV